MRQIQLLQISPEELQGEIIQGIKESLDDLKEHFQIKEPDPYLTRQDLSDLLKIDLSTVYNWTKKGILKAYQIGGRVYYKRAEVEQSMIELN
ncbi:helix-turn-helix domain-containing protein [Gilvibacter sp.]|uniref:helix-turn-helix domain-containing protein n=1 Tax=Gilvibacter sp. TaxID=2729997 RepID=UPI003B52E5F1